MGQPRCLLEQFAQHVWHHKLLWYIALAVTLSLAMQFGIGDSVHSWIYR